MKFALTIIVTIFLLNFAFSQEKCDSLPTRSDSLLLEEFWKDFKDAVIKTDKNKLEALCAFPLNCDYCSVPKIPKKGYGPLAIDKSLIDKTYREIFHQSRLIQKVLRHSTLGVHSIFHGHLDDNSDCRYSFAYIFRDENKQHPGMQRFFDIAKRGGKYQIVSTWTMP